MSDLILRHAVHIAPSGALRPTVPNGCPCAAGWASTASPEKSKTSNPARVLFMPARGYRSPKGMEGAMRKTTTSVDDLPCFVAHPDIRWCAADTPLDEMPIGIAGMKFGLRPNMIAH